ncbi:ATP-binding protein [Kitasatospora sp. NPDC001539]|uniref:ATP-binding protein n=1 Tax=Kitasatospora sp. NPDC001539 TaxID=3154384 RepID=UPI0033187056
MRPNLGDDVLVATAELLTNACVHGGGTRVLVLDYRPGVERVEVSDHNQAQPRLRPDARGQPGGYGLLVVERLTAGWGVTADAGGKTVWTELPTTRPRWC